MIKVIAKKELTEILRSGRFRWIAIVVFALLATALGFGWKSYVNASRDRAAAQRDSRQTWENQGDRNPHSAAHFGVYAFRPKTPLSLVDSGLDNFSGSSVWVEAHYQNPSRNRPIEDSTSLQRFGELTAAGVLQLLLPLFLIFLTFDVFAGERVSGTLRQVFALGVSHWQLVVGKMIGVFSALLIALVPAVLIGVGALALAGGPEGLLTSAPRFAALCFGYLLYLLTFTALALAVSAIAPSPRTGLVVLVAFWIVGCLLIPRLAGDVAANVHPEPSNKEFWDAVYKDMKDGIDGHNPSHERTKELERRILAQYGVTKKEDLPVNLNGLSLQASEEHSNKLFDKHFGNVWNIHFAQESFQSYFGAVSPLLPMRDFSMGMSGTDLRHQKHFSDSVEQYRRKFVEMLNLEFAYNSRTSDDYNYFVGREVWERAPDFVYEPPTAASAFAQQLRNLALLALWTVVSIGLSFWAAARMRIY